MRKRLSLRGISDIETPSLENQSANQSEVEIGSFYTVSASYYGVVSTIMRLNFLLQKSVYLGRLKGATSAATDPFDPAGNRQDASTAHSRLVEGVNRCLLARRQ